MTNNFYFQHDYNSRNDQKLLKIRAKFGNCYGYGLYWMFLESMAETKDGWIDGSALAELKLSFGLAEEELKIFINYCLEIEAFITKNNDKISTKRMIVHKEFRKERSLSGKKGANSKRNSSSAVSSATSSADKELQARKGKERKGKEIVSSPQALEVINYLNSKTGKNFKCEMVNTQKPVILLLNKGFTLDECKKVIDIKCEEWLKDDKMKQYLRPETLFGNKFDAYLNQKTVAKTQRYML